MARADTVIVCSLLLTKNAMHSPTSKVPSSIDEGVWFHSHHSGNDVFGVVSATGHLNETIQSPTDEHQPSL